jgi:hypothetical protein
MCVRSMRMRRVRKMRARSTRMRRAETGNLIKETDAKAGRVTDV